MCQLGSLWQPVSRNLPSLSDNRGHIIIVIKQELMDPVLVMIIFDDHVVKNNRSRYDIVQILGIPEPEWCVQESKSGLKHAKRSLYILADSFLFENSFCLFVTNRVRNSLYKPRPIRVDTICEIIRCVILSTVQCKFNTTFFKSVIDDAEPIKMKWMLTWLSIIKESFGEKPDHSSWAWFESL